MSALLSSPVIQTARYSVVFSLEFSLCLLNKTNHSLCGRGLPQERATRHQVFAITELKV